MYIGIDPEEKTEKPYPEIDKKNSLLDADLFSYSINSNKT